jgi:dTDP-4-dehydrorhamnose reductase
MAITTADYPLPAVRPAYGLLDSRSLAGLLGQDWPTWQQGVDRVLTQLTQLRQQAQVAS